MVSIDCRTSSRLLRSRLLRAQVASLLLLSAATMLLSGCGNFFQCEGKPSCPATTTTTTTTTGSTGSTGSSSTDYAYAANSATSANDLNAYSIGSGALTPLTGSPFSIGYSPSAMVVTPSDTFLYAANDSALTSGVGSLYGYSIGTAGALSILSSGVAQASESIAALAVSPDGQWLFCLDTNGITLEEYGINSSTGVLTYEASYGVTGSANAAVTPSSVTVAPTGDYVAIALGVAGVETFSFDTSTGVATAAAVINPVNAATGIYGVAADSNNYLYAVGTAGLQVFSTTTTGTPTLLKAYAAGNGAHTVAVNSASTYVYVGNETDSTISGYSIGTDAALTALSGSPYAAPTSVDALAVDSTGAYVIASGYNATNGIQLFTIGSAGALTLSGSAASGTATLDEGIPAPLAATP